MFQRGTFLSGLPLAALIGITVHGPFATAKEIQGVIGKAMFTEQQGWS
jgi:hypothetical protein